LFWPSTARRKAKAKGSKALGPAVRRKGRRWPLLPYLGPRRLRRKVASPAMPAWKLGLERRQLVKPNLARPSPQKAGNALAEARVLGLVLGKQRLISHGLSLVLCT
jgi:hypothetical protein